MRNNLALYLEYLQYPEPVELTDLYNEEDIVKGKTNNGKGWFYAGNDEHKSEFFMLKPGENHWDPSVAKKMQSVGWIDKPDSNTMEKIFAENKIIRFIINTNNENEPVTVESGGQLDNSIYIGIMKLMKNKVAGPLQKTAKIIWEYGKSVGQAIKKSFSAQEWQLA
jgi:hypothetical protein